MVSKGKSDSTSSEGTKYQHILIQDNSGGQNIHVEQNLVSKWILFLWLLLALQVKWSIIAS